MFAPVVYGSKTFIFPDRINVKFKFPLKKILYTISSSRSNYLPQYKTLMQVGRQHDCWMASDAAKLLDKTYKGPETK